MLGRRRKLGIPQAEVPRLLAVTTPVIAKALRRARTDRGLLSYKNVPRIISRREDMATIQRALEHKLYVASKKSADRILEESFHSRVSNLNMRSYL